MLLVLIRIVIKIVSACRKQNLTLPHNEISDNFIPPAYLSAFKLTSLTWKDQRSSCKERVEFESC